MASTADIKNGVVLNIDGQLWSVVEFQHVKPGKGGAFVRTKLKNVVSGKVVDKTYNAGTKIDIENVDRRDFTYLYSDGDGFVFMDTTDYDQITVQAAVVGDAKHFMLENQSVTIALNNGNPSTSTCPPRSCSRSRTPSRASRATAPRVARRPRPSRPGTRSRCRSSSRRVPRSRSTRARASTWAA
ncbi:hypothetical protein GCM10025870_00160 [Agromyces marinus]|uniref:Translation elongation factor P/YeiP central domain-containing protein n=1 Tax=Agromyces marinus TaxID=1389020 RepID=A0ABM8GWR8_9MICO|nr:hypothetical protein GCM10025870_00160 [Agromyces marinus]